MRPLQCGNNRCAYCNPNGNCINMSIIEPEKCPEWLDIEQRPSCETCEFYDTTVLKNCVNFSVCHNFSQYIRFKGNPDLDELIDILETAPKNNIQENKPRPSLIPLDVLIKHLCPAYEEGIPKYYRESWRKGFQTSVMIDAALRHITEFFWNGKDIDEESGKHHLAGAIFSLISILHTLDTRPELDDRIRRAK